MPGPREKRGCTGRGDRSERRAGEQYVIVDPQRRSAAFHGQCRGRVAANRSESGDGDTLEAIDLWRFFRMRDDDCNGR